MTMTATYSPEDNKLRLYSSTRLDGETYQRVKAHGFKWAPQQGLFVAPMWTPAREDLLLDLCGEIGDEDTSLVERAEERAERFGEYKQNRDRDAAQAHALVESICDHIPLGQPILVGHHSEARARRDAGRIESGMRRAIRMWDTAEYWKQRAAGALRHARYKERPDVRARRIKGLEADKRKQERFKAEAERERRFWQGGMRFKKGDQTIEVAITEDNRALIHDIVGTVPGLSSPLVESGGHYWSAWDLTRPEEERWEGCPQMTVPELQAAALASLERRLERCARWAAHYDNRLTYERAMLEADGGTVADRTGPEVGGGCQCWASPRGGWSYIQKVNKVSVTLLDNWGNGGGNFTRTIPFDKLKRIISKADVEAARAEGRLKDLPDGTGFVMFEGQPEPAKKAPPQPQDKPAEKLRAALGAGVQVVSAPQLFPTPPEVADRLIELAEIEGGQRILEPSAGTGRLIDACGIATDWECELVAVELNAALTGGLKAKYRPEHVRVVQADFLTCNGDLGQFDRVVMNPPFSSGADIRHILHARTFLKPGGKLVAICADGPRQRETLQAIADHWEPLEEGAFSEEGTNVRAAIVVLSAD